tara:strand:+ start:174 stop:1007 length:834 start_codon:yes stop_codon:yes gene_type:complete
MEQLAPRLSSSAKILAALTIIGTLVNLKLDLLNKSGPSLEEYIGFIIAAIFIVVALVSAKERKVPELSSSPSLEEQFAALEHVPTQTGGTKTLQQTHNSQTKSIIESIIGPSNDVDPRQIENAIDKLSEGEIGELSNSMVKELPAPHKYATEVLDYSDGVNRTPVNSSDIMNIPLPEMVSSDNLEPKPQKIISELPELPDLDELVKTDHSAVETSVKLPELPNLDGFLGNSDTKIESNSQKLSTPELPDIDGLSSNDENANNLEPKLPDLPNIDDLF